MGLKLLHYLKPVLSILPEVQKPDSQIQFKTRLNWTLIVILIYLVSCQIPIYGVVKTSSSDPFYWLRVILASNRGTLMELGISPTVTAGMVIQLLVGSKLIEVDKKDDKEKLLLDQAQKLLGILIAFFEAFAYVWSGMYGEFDQIGSGNALLIILQLTFAGVVVILLDEIISKGFGVGEGGGISLFIAINICESIAWKSFSPLLIKTDFGDEYEGSVIGLFHSLITHPDKLRALQQSFYRSQLPNLNNLLSTILVFGLIVFVQGFKTNLTIKNKQGGPPQLYPIKLFYTSNTPIILQTALVSNLYFLSQMLYKQFRGNFIIGLLGTWQELEMGGGQSVPVGGIVYYISPPRGISEFVTDPIHSLIYVIFVVGTCGLFSYLWIEISGSSHKDVLKQLTEQNMIMPGHRNTGKNNSTEKRLKTNIHTAAILGGMCVGVLTIIADFLGVIGSGTGILLAVTIIYGYIESYEQEKKKGVAIWG